MGKVEEPKVTSGKAGGTVMKHPAFSVVMAHRVSGRATLFGSSFQNESFVRLRIAAATLKRDLSTDSVFPDRDSYIEVDMSEVQWASLVSGVNIGGGVPCTLRRLNGESVPGLPSPTNRQKQFSDEADGRMKSALAEIERLVADVQGMKISQKQKDVLRHRADVIRAEISTNQSYVAEQFNEHMEHVIESAKVEINAHAANVFMGTGRDALAKPQLGMAAGDDAAPLTLPSITAGRDA